MVLMTFPNRRFIWRQVWGVALICVALWAQVTFAQTDSESVQASFERSARPFLMEYCSHCHNADDPQSGVHVDHLDGAIPDSRIRLWEAIQRQLQRGAMPPKEEEQPTTAQREKMLSWISEGLKHAKSRVRPKNGVVRRLTVEQYRNTLRELLGIEDDFTDILPPDAVSKDGFKNNQETLLLSPLLLEAYFSIAEQALDRCLVDPEKPPTVQSFRMDLGEGINSEPCPDNLILGANSLLLRNQDFMVTELEPEKPFKYFPFAMQRKFRFHEGYQGNATVRGWREYDSIYHAVFACMRGTRGYPKGDAYETIPDGLLLRPAIPSPELFGQSSTYGPQANFKISLRELPEHGKFQVRVNAAVYDDALLLDQATKPRASVLIEAPDPSDETLTWRVIESGNGVVDIPQAGIYQLDIHFVSQGKAPPAKEPAASPWGDRPVEKGGVTIQLGACRVSGRLRRARHLPPNGPFGDEHQQAFLVRRLPQGPLKVYAKTGSDNKVARLVLHRLDASQPLVADYERFEHRLPQLGVHLGLRRDCGSTLNAVGAPQAVSGNLRTYVFSGAMANYPRPYVQEDNDNYLAGVKEIGIRCEYTDGRDRPRLLVRSVEFEGPYYEAWPPESHERIFVPSPLANDKQKRDAYAREVLTRFASRAFRRPPNSREVKELMSVWRDSYSQSGKTDSDFRKSVRDALVVALTSPQFLFLVEQSESPEPERLDEFELASKLSYFLWNTAPDDELLRLARANELYRNLDAQFDRMVTAESFSQFAEAFVSQWMDLQKFDVLEADRKRYPSLTRDTRTELRKEPIRFVEYLFRHDLPIGRLLQSDFILGNEVVASYYGMGDRTETGFSFRPIKTGRTDLGGLLSTASILAGLSDGREPNPVKRGAWFARKIIAKPPADPPPNVPQLDESSGEDLTLREKLLRHRDQAGCRECHSGIDPWGVPFQKYDAGGLRTGKNLDASSTLPDGQHVDDLDGLRSYLLRSQQQQIAFSVLKHLMAYGTGRTLSYNEIESLRRKSIELRDTEYPMKQLLREVIHSDIFLTK